MVRATLPDGWVGHAEVERNGLVVDPGAHWWVLTQHLHDTDPSEWFGQVFGPLLG